MYVTEGSDLCFLKAKINPNLALKGWCHLPMLLQVLFYQGTLLCPTSCGVNFSKEWVETVLCGTGSLRMDV